MAYRPKFIEPENMLALGFELLSDKDGYLKYQNNGTHHWNMDYSNGPEPKGKVIVYINTVYNTLHEFFLGIRQDGDTRTVYNGVCSEESFFLLLLESIR